VRSPPSVEAALLMAKTAWGSHTSQSSFRPLAKARSVSLSTLLTRSARALVSLWYADPMSRLDPMRRTMSRLDPMRRAMSRLDPMRRAMSRLDPMRLQ
jgi:hypothetical protein